MRINPISTRITTSNVRSAKEVTPSKITAAKVEQIPLPLISQKGGMKERRATQLKEVSNLSKAIYKNWDDLSTEELAAKIIELQDRVSMIEGNSSPIEKVKKQIDHLHFKFVFPLVSELAQKGSSFSFARTIHEIAGEILKKGSIAPFHELSVTQQKEITRYAHRGG